MRKDVYVVGLDRGSYTGVASRGEKGKRTGPAKLPLSWTQGDPLQLQMRVRHHSERGSTPRSERHVRWRSPPPQWASRSSWRAWPSAARRFLVTIQFRCPNLMCWTSTPRHDEPLVRPNGWTSCAPHQPGRHSRSAQTRGLASRNDGVTCQWEGVLSVVRQIKRLYPAWFAAQRLPTSRHPICGSAHRPLSHTDPVSGTSKQKLENGEERLTPENHRPGTKSLKIAGQRLEHSSLRHGCGVPSCATCVFVLIMQMRLFGRGLHPQSMR